MKKLIKRTLIFILPLCLSGCVDLAQEPNSFVTPENMTYDKAKMENLANGLYNLLWYNNYGYNCRMQWVNVRADDVMAGSFIKADTRLVTNDRLRFDATSMNTDVSYLYAGFYKLIQGANLLIEGLMASTSETEELRQSYIAEAKFMRAFAYFNLVRLFGDVPAITSSMSNEDVLHNTTIGRNKVADIYDHIIIPDLIYAETYLSPAGRKADNSTASIDAAKICLADVYLTMAGWPLKRQGYHKLAYEKAAEVIGSTQGYELIEYSDLWQESKKGARKEHIFALHHSKTGNFASNYGTSYMSSIELGNAWQDYLGDSVFFEKYPADKRRDFNFVSAYKGGFQNRQKMSWRKVRNSPILGFAPSIKKYENFGAYEGGSTTPNNTGAQTDGITPIYRLADAYLIYAEAQNRADGSPNALSISYVNKIRDRAYRAAFTETKITGDPIKDRVMPDKIDGITSVAAKGHLAGDELGSGFEQAVWDERGWEFFAEFKRWFELVRTERVEAANADNKRINPSDLRNPNNRYLPLPINEVSLNKWQNNPGY